MVKLKTLAAAALATTLSMSASAGELRFDSWPDYDKWLDQQLPKFQEKNKDVKVDLLTNNWVDHHSKLTTAIATGSGAGDVVAVDVEQLGPYLLTESENIGFVNLSKEFGADKLEKLYPAYAWQQSKGLDGDIYALPLNLGPGVMYYRREHMEGKGFKVDEVIKDWDSLITYGEKLKEKGVPLVGHAGSIAQAIINTTVEPGNSLYFDKDGKTVVTNERFVKALTIAQQVRQKGLDARIGDWSGEWFDGLKQGSFAIQLSGAWFAGHLENSFDPDEEGKKPGRWGVSALPDGIVGAWGGSFLAIPKQSKNQKEAWALLEFLATNNNAQLDLFKSFSYFPSLVATFEDPMFKEPMQYLGGQVAREMWADIAVNIKPIQPSKGDLIARAVILENTLPLVVEEGKDVKEALKEAERLINRRMRAAK